MAKKNVSDLAKDLGVDVKHVLGHLEKIGRKRTTPRTPLTEEEVEKVRDLHAEASRPEIRIGEERTTMTETGVATDVRVSASVIKRRKLSQAPSADEPPPPPVAYDDGDDGTLPPPPAEFLSEELPPLPPEIPFESPMEEPLIEALEETPESPEAIEAVAEPEPEDEPIAEKVREPEAPAAAPIAAAPPAGSPAPVRVTPPPAAPRPPTTPTRSPPTPQRPVAPARPSAPLRAQTPGRPALPTRPPLTLDEPMKAAVVLGRIDLKKAEAARTAGPARPGDAQRRPGVPGTATGLPPPATPEGESAEKKGRKKLKVIKKDVLDNERYSRGGRLPKKKRALPGKEQKKTEITVPKASKRVIRISDAISVGDLARQMGVKAGEILKKLMDMGMMATINQALDFDTATLVATDFEYAVENVAFDAESAVEESHVGETETEETGKEPRPPVVTIMGHVDHGKTSLLDAVRQTKVTEGEAGGITQHIGAYSVPWNDRQITFVDTPGHEAFTAMRARGAKVTDIVILVVAADDGVMPQTREAIDHARAAKVPIVVAVNKIDRPDANLEKVKRELADNGLAAEDWGGDTTVVPVSAKTKEGIPELLEMILLQADVLDLKATSQKLARGVIIEAKLERGRGPVATVLVQEGTLKAGDAFVCGTQAGRVRAMMDERGRKLESAGPSMPVEVLGFQGIPEAGDVFSAMSDEATARQVGEHRFDKQRETQLAATSKASLENFFDRMKAGDVKELRVILKADVQGSVEAVKDALSRFSTDEVKLSVIHAAVGAISETDVNLASASEAIIIGFNIRPEGKAADLAEREGVEIRLYTIIYDALRDVHAALEGLLEPIIREKTVGRAEVKQPFPIPGLGTIAGSMVTDGKVTKGAQARLVRDSVQVWRGKVSNLRRFKDDVREVLNGLECGIQLENYNDLKPGDVIELFETEQVARRLAMPSTRGGAAAERHA